MTVGTERIESVVGDHSLVNMAVCMDKHMTPYMHKPASQPSSYFFPRPPFPPKGHPSPTRAIQIPGILTTVAR